MYLTGSQSALSLSLYLIQFVQSSVEECLFSAHLKELCHILDLI